MRGSFTRRHRGTVGHEAEPTQGVRRSTCDRHAEVLLDEVRELVVGADHDTATCVTAPSSSTKTTPAARAP